MNKSILILIGLCIIMSSLISGMEYSLTINATGTNATSTANVTVLNGGNGQFKIYSDLASLELSRAKVIQYLFAGGKTEANVKKFAGVTGISTRTLKDIGYQVHWSEVTAGLNKGVYWTGTLSNLGAGDYVYAWSKLLANDSAGNKRLEMPSSTTLHMKSGAGISNEFGVDTSGDDTNNPENVRLIADTSADGIGRTKAIIMTKDNITWVKSGDTCVGCDGFYYPYFPSIPEITYGTLEEGFTLNFKDLAPYNLSNINQTTSLTFVLDTVPTVANCTYSINGTTILTKYGLPTGTYNFSFNNTFWLNKYNRVKIFCNASNKNRNQSKTFFVDNVRPIIKYVTYQNSNDVTTNLNNTLFSVQYRFNLSIRTNDTNNYLLNVTIKDSSGVTKFTNRTVNITKQYDWLHYINMENWSSSNYTAYIKSGDGHTLLSIDYNKDLKEKEVINSKDNKIGKIIDDKLKIETESGKVYEFNLIPSLDRKKFNLKFQKGVELFEMYVSGESSVVYVGNKYGYDGHFIIDDYYWYDLENKYNAKIQTVTKIDDLNYKILLKKDKNIDEITFDSIGIININQWVLPFQYVYTNTTINLRDSDTKNLISGINMTVEYVGTNYQTKKTTTTGITRIITRFDEPSDDVSIRAYQTNNDDYSIVIIQETLYQDVNQNITLYLTNTSDIDTTNLVTFHIQDENGYNLLGAKLTILKQDPATNTYLTITELTTNQNADATTILETDSVFYKFIVYYDDVIVYQSAVPITISINDDLINLVGILDPSFTDDYINFVGLDTTLTFYNTSANNSAGYFKTTVASLTSIEACLYIEQINASGQFFNQSSCQNGTSISITSSTLSPSDIKYYRAILKVRYDGVLENYRQIIEAIGGVQVKYSDKTEGMFILFVMLLFCALGFVLNVVVGMILLCILLIFLSLTHLTPLTLSQAFSIISLLIISIFTYTRIKKQ